MANTHAEAQYAGHETFPLRLGWLKKVHDASFRRTPDDISKMFRSPTSMSEFGVGKNMLMAMRHWSIATGVLHEEDRGKLALTDFAKRTFADKGDDPYLENADTLWWLHWTLVGRGVGTAATIRAGAWFAAFNFVDVEPFNRNDLQRAILRAADVMNWKGELPTDMTLKRDVECLLRSYVSNESTEDAFSCPFLELHLIEETERGYYQFNRGPKASLSLAQLWRMIEDYWDFYPSSGSILLDDILSGVGSPGRALKLDRDSVYALLPQVSKLSRSKVSVTDVGGRAQLVRLDRSPRQKGGQ